MPTAEQNKITQAQTEASNDEKFDASLTPHVLTDKEQTKTVPCVECSRACVVTTFLAPAKCLCRECKGDGPRQKTTGSQASVQPGRTAPEFAKHLPDALINKEFLSAACPFSPDHKVVLKDIGHSSYYGPRHLLGYKDGIPQYDQKIGEVATFQCEDCAVLVQFSTQHPRQLRPCNKPKQSTRTGPSAFETMLGVEDEEQAA